MKKKSLGRFITADPMICHGQFTFKGTRMLVADVLELVADGMDWDQITQECHGRVSRAAIAEAIRLAGREMSKRADEERKRAVPA